MDDNQPMDTLRRAFTEGCSLDDIELEERIGEIERLTSWALRQRHDAAGTTVLSFDRAAAADVRDLVRRERECCGHLEFDVEEIDDVIRVGIRPRPAEPPTSCGCPMCGG
jgi:hypothetical protein